jgi:putative hydrolase of the HAD superfamily
MRLREVARWTKGGPSKHGMSDDTVTCVPTYTACLIDVFDTVLTVDFGRRASSLAQLAGVDADAFTEAVGSWGAAVMTGKSTIRSALKEVLRNLGSAVDDERLDQLMSADGQLLRDLAVVHDDTEPFLEMLRNRGVRTAFVSNCSEDARPLLEGLGLSNAVDELVLSCEVGAAKPDPQIFAVALDLLGVDAHQTVFVDDQQRYCKGASAMGLRTFLIDRIEGTGEISELAELAAHF